MIGNGHRDRGGEPNRRTVCGWAAFLGVSVSTLSCASSGPILNYDLERGDRFTLTVDREEIRERTIGGNHMVDTTRVHSVNHFEITGERDDAVEVTVEYGDRTGEVGAGEETSSAFEKLRGRRATFWLDHTGGVTDPDGFHRLPMIPFAGGTFDAQQYVMELRSFFPRLPDETLEPGTTWKHREELQDTSSGTPLDIVMDFVYTLEGPAEDAPGLLAIDGVYDISVTGAVDAGDFFLQLDMAGQGTEKIVFDPERNMIATSRGTMSIDGEAVNEEVGFRVPLRNEHRVAIRAGF